MALVWVEVWAAETSEGLETALDKHVNNLLPNNVLCNSLGEAEGVSVSSVVAGEDSETSEGAAKLMAE